MANYYSVSGLTLECNRPLPRLTAKPEAIGERTPDGAQVNHLQVEMGSFPADAMQTPEADWRSYFKSSFVNDRGEPVFRVSLRAAGDLYRFVFDTGVHFLVDRKGQRVWARWAEPNTLEDVSCYLFGIVLSFVLRLHGVISLHASAVVIEGQAVAFAGPAGAGKSTTAAAFAQRGYPVLADDSAVLKPVAGSLLVQPVRHELKLWPDMSSMLFGSVDALPRLSPGWDKQLLDLDQHGFRTEDRPRPLAAVYLLDGEPVKSPRPAIRALRGPDGFVALLAYSLVTRLLDRRMRIQEFDLLTRLSETLPVRRLHKPEVGLPPHELCELIINDLCQRSGRRLSA